MPADEAEWVDGHYEVISQLDCIFIVYLGVTKGW